MVPNREIKQKEKPVEAFLTKAPPAYKVAAVWII